MLQCCAKSRPTRTFVLPEIQQKKVLSVDQFFTKTENPHSYYKDFKKLAHQAANHFNQ